MNRSKSQYARLMELDRLIRIGKYPNCLTFAADWGVSQKTVQRDIDFLRDQCGAPVEYDRERKGFFYVDDAWMLPSVMLTEGELLAVLLASRMMEQYRGTPVAGEVERVFRKLAELLPDRISIRPELLYTRFSFRGMPAKPVKEDVWAMAVRGVLEQRTLKIAYRTFDAAEARKGKMSRVQPYHIANLQGEWYLFGVHAGYDDVRQFALARIERAVLTEETFDQPDDFDPEAILSSAFARYAGDGETRTVRLLFTGDAADWVQERTWHPAQTIKRRKSDAVELSFPAKGMLEVQRWVLSWGSEVQVLAPKELKEDVATEIRAMAACAP